MKKLLLVLASLVAFAATLSAQDLDAGPKDLLKPIPASVTYAPANPALPTIFLAGDSTATLWGPPAVTFFDPAKVNVVPAGASGRSSRTYITEGLWARVMKQVKPHDIVVIQFGRNDAQKINNDTRARGTIPGAGDESQSIVNGVTHQPEVVHTFGWYTRQMVREVKAKGATPIVMSMTPRNVWKDGKIVRGDADYGQWDATIAKDEHVAYVDITDIIIAQYEKLGQEKTTSFFKHDTVHAGQGDGAVLNATWIVQGLKGILDSPITPFLSAKGAALEPLKAQ